MTTPARSRGDDARRQVVVIAVAVAVLVAGIGVAATSVPTGTDDVSSSAPLDATDGLDRLHDAGVTGQNVSVGVVGVTGFDPDSDDLDGRVADSRSFAAGETIRNGGRNDHGTAAASLVAQTAPGADLHLASFDTADGFRDAVAWLVRNDVDVIVAPVSFYGKAGDGSSAVARVASLAADHGVAFVAPVGNLGQGHWQGRFAPTDRGVHGFDGGTRNHLLGDSRRLTLWLSWEECESPCEFSMELYRSDGPRSGETDGTDSRLVARSRPYPSDDTPNERIVARIDPQATYYFVIRGSRNATATPIEASSPTHRFQFRERAGSVVAPATARDALAVGAYDSQRDRVEPFSSAGPLDDGRPGVDVVAPDRLRAAGEPGGLVGSSAAAPYAAGVVALVLDANPDLEPGDAETVLERTARDVGRPGADLVVGDGLVAPRRAVERARNITPNRAQSRVLAMDSYY
ncbi:S8 family serine peptidase [Halorussus salinisoli]|uniref:S8 family serine peptidase n=1 Tax=Halorussus salinisoli TaxID=2558242 RepID=UPI0010C1E9CA|nr:S8 family serine peptidase [Halorussus salinisoli]